MMPLCLTQNECVASTHIPLAIASHQAEISGVGEACSAHRTRARTGREVAMCWGCLED